MSTPLNSPLDEHSASTATHHSVGVGGGTIGPYRLLEQLGEGGMGEVWLAEQTRPIRRQVALKIIKAGMDTAQVVRRFEAERQALALMDHPAIAKVFDAGATELGRSYFVMEYVRGESVTAYCDRQRLTIRDRLHLFLHICEGVQHAHQKGIIHRDLKPSNILVTMQDDQPVPKIIDFGVAKAMSRPLTEHTLYTALSGFVGTVEYMSPEQAEMGGADIDTRTDVYALGILLYELLTGVLPFDRDTFAAKPVDEIRRTIREVDPARPSTRIVQLGTTVADVGARRRIETSRLRNALRGDLDWITMKALEKDRARRYGSISDFGADIKRYLTHQPVAAGPPSAVYRSRKFIQRHRLAVSIAAGLVIMLASVAIITAVQAQRLGRERDRANAEARRANQEAAAARQVTDFLIGLFKVSDPSEARGNALTAREILDNGARQIEKNLKAQPEVRARLQATIGTVYTNLGLYASAEPLLHSAVDTYFHVTGPDSPETLAASSALADEYFYAGRFSQAEALYRELVEARTRRLGPEHADTLRSSFDLASVYFVRNELQDAEAQFRRIADAQSRVIGKEHPDTLATLNNLGVILLKEQHYADAAVVTADLLETRRRVLGDMHPDTLRSLYQLGVTYGRLGRLAEAERLLIQAKEGRQRVVGEAHPTTILTMSRLADVYVTDRKYADAESELLTAARLLRLDIRSPVPPGAFYIEGAEVNIAGQLSDLYRAWGKTAKAAEWSMRARRTK